MQLEPRHPTVAELSYLWTSAFYLIMQRICQSRSELRIQNFEHELLMVPSLFWKESHKMVRHKPPITFSLSSLASEKDLTLAIAAVQDEETNQRGALP
jgi:hypothetical protein